MHISLGRRHKIISYFDNEQLLVTIGSDKLHRKVLNHLHSIQRVIPELGVGWERFLISDHKTTAYSEKRASLYTGSQTHILSADKHFRNGFYMQFQLR